MIGMQKSFLDTNNANSLESISIIFAKYVNSIRLQSINKLFVN
jgi:hypothetical protein